MHVWNPCRVSPHKASKRPFPPSLSQDISRYQIFSTIHYTVIHYTVLREEVYKSFQGLEKTCDYHGSAITGAIIPSTLVVPLIEATNPQSVLLC